MKLLNSGLMQMLPPLPGAPGLRLLQRLAGLMGQAQPRARCAAHALHQRATCFMRQAIDIVHLDRQGHHRPASGVAPWRLSRGERGSRRAEMRRRHRLPGPGVGHAVAARPIEGAGLR